MTTANLHRFAMSMLCIALFSFSAISQTILYVKPVASGAADGSSWADASADLKGLMDVAAANTQIWVAAGTYFPTATTNRSISFIMRPGVEVFGGFAGNEAMLTQRNWVTNKTILSGNIGDPALGTDNSYHVVVGNSTLLDGFTLTDGLANESTALDYGGGALYNNVGAAVLQNCILRNNSAVTSGGAVLSRSGAWPKFINCQFINNYAGSYGGAIFVISARVSATNCTFTGNAQQAITGDIGSNSLITNCSFFQNNGGVRVMFGSLTLSNSIIWASGAAIQSIGGGTVIQNTNLINIDPLFNNGPAGDLQLQPCSPAIDAGTDALNTTTVDLNGNNRKVDLLPNAALIDIGAYELQSGKCCPPSNVLYVNAAATGGNNGSSWANAYTDLQAALANDCPGVTEIWVAKGTYYTGDGPDRLVSFRMKKGQAIYGGFAGGETMLSQRDWVNNKTILSGDMDRNGILDAGNSFSVIKNQNSFLTNSDRLDGFTITGGNSVGGGAGMYNINASPTVANCSFTENIAAYEGGAILNLESEMRIENTVFTNNYAGTFGGAVANYLNASISITNCMFLGNTAGQQGGAMLNNSLSAPKVSNSVFSGNVAGNFGGAIMTSSAQGGTYTNCTITGNSAGLEGGALYNYNGASPVFINSILWNNRANANTVSSSATSFLNGGTANFKNCVVANSQAGVSWQPAIGVDNGDNLDQDPQFVLPVDLASLPSVTGDLRLQPCSPVIDAGDDAASSLATDLAGQPRKVDLQPNAAQIDLGAYELQNGQCCPPSNVLFVNAAATGLNNGTSWADAYTDLQEALANTCPGVTEIWVAKGYYYPTTDPANRLAAFKMRNKLAIYGGFAGNETLLSQRDWNNNETILSGDIDKDLDYNDGDNSYNIVRNDAVVLDNTARLDGFTLEGGYANGSANQRVGAAIVDVFNSAVYANCSFERNYSLLLGGAVYGYQNSSVFTNCRFRGNRTDGAGGALMQIGGNPNLTGCAFQNNQSADLAGAVSLEGIIVATIKSCRFSNNNSAAAAGALRVTAGTLDCENSEFTMNSSAGAGGGALRLGSTNAVLKSCNFIGNTSTGEGGAAYASDAPAKFIACQFQENITTRNAGALRMRNVNATLTDCSFMENEAKGTYSGAIYADANVAMTTVISGCSFTKNKAWSAGGAINTAGLMSTYISKSLFEGNHTDPNISGIGGAIFGTAGKFFISQSRFVGNQAARGGAIAINPLSATEITNSVFSGNLAQLYGGAISAFGQPIDEPFLTINHSTITGSESGTADGGAIRMDEGRLDMTNSIIWNNKSQGSTQNPLASFWATNGTFANFSNNIIANSGGSTNWQLSGSTDLGGNLDINPLFVQDVDLNSLPNTTGDLHLLTCSPAIDKAAGSETVDLDDNARPANNGYDMGAYEYQGILNITAFVLNCPSGIEVSGCSTDAIATASGLPYSSSPSNISQQQFADAGGSLTAGTCPISSIQYLDAVDVDNSTTAKTIIIRTFTVSDASAHTATCTQALSIEDNTPPIITCPAAITVACAGDVPAPDVSLVTASDLCSAAIVTHVGDVISNQTCANKFTITRTYKATDAAGNEASCTQIITVADNVPPTITGLTPSVLSLWPANHKMRDITLSYTATDNCADAVSIQVSISSNEKANSIGDGDTEPDYDVIDNTHIRLRAERDGGGTGRVYTINIKATDVCGNSTSSSTQVVVAHNISAPISGRAFKIGSTVSFAGTFWDIPGNRHSARWVIDDNTTSNGSIVSEPSSTQNGTVSGSYKFNNPGVYKLRMEITDQNGNISYANTAGDLDAIVVIYDPNGGNTYGGGSFKSPVGAYPANPQLTGEVSYGFQNNYFKTAAKPRGETQMRFELGDFEFNAVNFDYLVVDKYKAQLSGYGKIANGQSGVAFVMTVIDGQVKGGGGTDLIRLKVYNKNTGEIYYDNQPGASDADLPTTPVTQGSTVVINIEKSGTTKAATELITDALQIKVGNNPTTGGQAFRLQVLSTDQLSPISLRVLDATGKAIQSWNGLTTGSTLETGGNWSKGLYIAEATQNKKRVIIKLLKQ